MAAYVKGRFRAARVGVTMAIMGLLAGLGIKSESQPTTTTVFAEPASLQTLAKNTIGSAQIKNHSLLFSDLKLHQVPSYKEFKFFTTQFNDKWLKLDTANLVHKADVYDKHLTDSTFLKIEDAGAQFLKLDGTAQNALKINGLGSDQLIQGHGQVITGSTAVGDSDSDVFILVGLLKASAKNSQQGGGADVTLTNLSATQTLLVNGDGKPGSLSTTIGPGGTDTVSMGDGTVRTLQVVIQGGTQAITIGLSTFTGGVRTLVGQAVVGSY
jgi:hypothetical protein